MTFSYKSKTAPEKHIYDFIDKYGFKLKVERKDNNIARIYFLDESNKVISKPDGLRCVDKTMKEPVSCDNLNGVECFIITWYNDYNIFFNERLLKIISNQRQQSITNPITENIRRKKMKEESEEKKENIK